MTARDIRAFLATLSRRPERVWPDAVQHHGARIGLMLVLAFLTSLLFPVTAVPDLPAVERGSVLSRDIIAEFDFRIPRNEAELQRDRDQAAAGVAPVFRYDGAALDTMRERITKFLDRVDSTQSPAFSHAESERALRNVLTLYSLPTRPDVVAVLRSSANRNALRRSLRLAISDMPAGVARAADLQVSVSPQLRIIGPNGDMLVARDSVPTGQMWRDASVRHLRADAPAELAEFHRLVLIGLFQPTLRYDAATTETAKQSARDAVPLYKGEVLAGERVVAAHERIREEDIERLRAYQSELAARGRLQPGAESLLRTAGSVLLNALLLAVFGVMVHFYRPHVYRSYGAMLFLAFLFLSVAVPAAFVARAAAPTTLIPIAFPALAIAMLWDGRMALAFALVLGTLLTLQTGLGELSARALLVAAGAAAALSVRVVHRRKHGLILGVVIAAAYVLASIAVGLLLSWDPTAIGTAAAWGSANGIACALIAVGLMPVFEAWTGITTDQTLLELGDLNGPLLKRLSLEASGTYAHSVNAAHLAEAAARAIGANPLLARVGAYYHDIGKITAPQYFVENQAGGRNPHDRLSPEESVSIIRGHVQEGLRMAASAKLPECVRSFIPEHHGNQLIGFFFEKAKQLHGDDALDPADYSYTGPRPRTRETAILMLADSVESAAKVLDTPTTDRIRDLVERIVQGKISRGQLDDAPLTFRDLARIKLQFVSVLSGMYHHRLDYPPSAIGERSLPHEPSVANRP